MWRGIVKEKKPCCHVLCLALKDIDCIFNLLLQVYAPKYPLQFWPALKKILASLLKELLDYSDPYERKFNRLFSITLATPLRSEKIRHHNWLTISLLTWGGLGACMGPVGLSKVILVESWFIMGNQDQVKLAPRHRKPRKPIWLWEFIAIIVPQVLQFSFSWPTSCRHIGLLNSFPLHSPHMAMTIQISHYPMYDMNHLLSFVWYNLVKSPLYDINLHEPLLRLVRVLGDLQSQSA